MSNQSPKTEEAYYGAGQLLVKFLGDVPIQDVTFEKVRDWRNWLLGWQAADTVRGNTICLRMVLKFLRKKGYKVLDYEEIPVPKRSKRVIKFLTEDEVQLFIEEAGRKRRGYPEENRLRNVALITLLNATGLRNSELCSLNRNTIKNRTFTIIGKSKNERIGFDNEQAEEAVARYLECRTDRNPALFTSPQTGKRITSGTVRKIFMNICARSDFENVTPRTIRHSYATTLLERGVDIIYISDLMGHEDLNTTKIYTHYRNPKLKAIYDNAQNVT